MTALTTRLQESHPEYTRLQESRQAKERDLHARGQQFEERGRAGDDYKKAEAARTAARKAVDDEKKRIEQEKSKEVAELDARIEKLQKESGALRNNALKSDHLLGRNPCPGRDAARAKDFQQGLVYHTTADWEDRTPEEVAGTVPPKMKQWLLRLRGY